MEKDVLETIYIRYRHALYLYALSLTHNRDDAEDLVSETFIKAFLSYTGKGNIQAWLYRVLKNLFIDETRKKKKSIQTEDSFIEQFSDPRIAEILLKEEDDERKKWLYTKIFTLPKIERDVLLLSLTSGLDDTAIAKQMGISEGNLRVIRHRAKNKIRKMVETEE